MRRVVYLLLPMLLLSCVGGESETQSPETPETPESPEVKSYYLEADGVSDTYTLLNENGYYEEVPDLGYNPDRPTCGHNFTHIQQVWDELLSKYVFALYLHVEQVVDTDRCKVGMEDRQRNEIKTYSGSPETMYGTYGETHTYGWKFHLAQSHSPTSEFTHIHQIKAAGGDDDSEPIIAFTTRSSTPDRLEVVYRAPVSGDKTYIAKIDLDKLRGEWIQANEKLTYEYGGAYSLQLTRVSDGELLLDYSATLDLWRNETDLVRPKWGMYRKVYTDTTATEMIDGLVDEVILLSDIELVED